MSKGDIDPMKLQPGDKVGHLDDDFLLFEVVKVTVDEGDEDVKPFVTEVLVKSLRTWGGEWAFTDGDNTSNLSKIGPPSTREWKCRGRLEKEQIEQHEKMAAKTFAGFRLKKKHLLTGESFRRWRFGHPDHNNMSFDLVLWPGHLIITGDIHDCWWSRTRNMLSFANSSIRGRDYFASKAVGVHRERSHKWSAEAAESWVWERYAERVESLLMENQFQSRRNRRKKKEYSVAAMDWVEVDRTDADVLAELRDARDKLLLCVSDGGENGFGDRVYNHTDWIDGGDYPDLKLWDHGYLWAESGVKVALKLLGYKVQE